MTDARLRELRRAVRSGALPDDLLHELKAIVRALVRRRALPPSFAPYGRWDEEAAEEIFADWYTDRLLGRGHLAALLNRAGTPDALRALAHRSLRQHLLNAADRSQAINLYRRTIAALDEPDRYTVVADAARPQDRWYALAATLPAPPPWAGSDRDLIAHLWALGDFAVIRYRAAATKLSPVLDAAELHRLLAGLLVRTGAALTPALIMRAISHRFDLGDVQIATLDDPERPVADPPATTAADTALLIRDTAAAILDELTARQKTILRRSSTETVAAIAQTLGCSAGTIVNEQRRIGMIVDRLSDSDAERDQLLHTAADLLYETGDA